MHNELLRISEFNSSKIIDPAALIHAFQWEALKHILAQ